MKLLRETVRQLLLNESIEFRMLNSPLTYNRGSSIMRLALCDSTVSELPSQRDLYFKEYQEIERYGKSGKRLKKPRKGTLNPGVSDPCIIGFLDYHEDYTMSSGGTAWYIDYVKTRQDTRGTGTASKLFDHFYDNIAVAGDSVSFGKMMRQEIGHLKDKMVEHYPEIKTIGARNW